MHTELLKGRISLAKTLLLGGQCDEASQVLGRMGPALPGEITELRDSGFL